MYFLLNLKPLNCCFFSDLQTKWSLFEQLDFATTARNPSIESIIDEAPSPHSSVSADAFFNEECSVLSPISESDDSGVSSCHSPYGNCSIEELDSSSCLQGQETDNNDISKFSFDTDSSDELMNLLENIQTSTSNEEEQLHEIFDAEVPSFNMGQELMPYAENARQLAANPGLLADFPVFQQNDQLMADSSVELVETNQVPFIEHTELPPVVVKEGSSDNSTERHSPIHIVPYPVAGLRPNQKLFVLKAEPVSAKSVGPLISKRVININEGVTESVRSSPYPKNRPSKSRTPAQKEKKKDQNRSAALRYRSKKKDELNDLFEEAQKLEETNKGLSDKVTSLTKEIDYLKGLMLDVIKAKLARSNSQN